MSDTRGLRKEVIGRVVSNKMDKTIVVEVTRRLKHRVYHKYVSQRQKYKAHDEKNVCNVGDTVAIRETRPLSKEKRWRLVSVKERAKI